MIPQMYVGVMSIERIVTTSESSNAFTDKVVDTESCAWCYTGLEKC